MSELVKLSPKKQCFEFFSIAHWEMHTHYRICMVSDFFYPNMGGVEMHIWCLAQCLIERGHKVIVVTHAYEGRQGIRYMTNGLKVYYLPIQVVYDQVILPTLFSFFALFRNILIRERISFVHGHQSVSPLTHECLLYARTLGYRTCYTDHSLFGFAEISSIHINKLLQLTLSDVDHVICVSNACRENLVIRARLHPSLVSTIPNAVDTTKFTPNPAQRSTQSTVNIVVLSRLVYRKGIDLLIKLIPYVCSKHSKVKFIIGGDGPKRILLEEMRERYQLHDRVELLGAIPHHKVHDTLLRGHIFLNCSLTESFCIALLEAASCGLFVVSTNVGGVPEVLPPSMITFAAPNYQALADAVLTAIPLCKQIDPWEFHKRVTSMYNWLDVTKRTEIVYHHIHALKKPKLLHRILRHMSAGPVAGILVCLCIVLLHLYAQCCIMIYPREEIEIAQDIRFHRSNTSSSSSSRTRTVTTSTANNSSSRCSMEYKREQQHEESIGYRGRDKSRYSNSDTVYRGREDWRRTISVGSSEDGEKERYEGKVSRLGYEDDVEVEEEEEEEGDGKGEGDREEEMDDETPLLWNGNNSQHKSDSGSGSRNRKRESKSSFDPHHQHPSGIHYRTPTTFPSTIPTDTNIL